LSVRDIPGLLAWLLLSFAAGAIGSQYMPGPWYAALAKPAWTPPGAVFAPVWTMLYALMGVAAWLVWRRRGIAGASVALAAFIAQLVLNALWSYLFFGMHRIGLALLDIVVLWVMILVVGALFWREDRRAGAMMVPYLAWVGFAACLNFAIWCMNAGLAG
jgi:tryptophan-rich sensory protein